MSRNFVVGIVAVSLAIGGWALGQQEEPAPALPAPAESGPFAVSPAGDSAVLLDTASGKTWMLTRSVDGETVCWLPVERFEDVERWKQREKRITAELIEQQKRRHLKPSSGNP